MGIIEAFWLGVVEGITEFLPISSTGHLIVLSKLLGVEQTSVNKAFEIIIQLAAILALVFVYPSRFTFRQIDLWLKIVVAFLPIAIVGLLFAKQIKALFSVEIVAIMFIVGGIIFIVVERFYNESNKKTISIDNTTYKQALIIGIAQVFSLIPGTSRAGASIIGAMIVGFNRKASAEFSFLLAVPVMCATTFYDIYENYAEIIKDGNFINLAVGFITSFIVAYLVIKLFLKFLEKFTFIVFAIYRILFGILLIWLF